MSKTSTLARAYQHKQFAFQVKAVDDAQGLIEAYGSVFDNEDQGGDVVRPGAFKRTIQNSKGRVQAGKAKFLAMMLWQHDPDQPIGGWTDLTEDARGLLCKGQIVLSTQRGQECYELIKAGVINEFSIGYDIPQGGANYDSKSGLRNLTELRLWEVSPVTFAMNQEALLTSVKGTQPMPPKSKQRKTVLEHFNEETAQDLLEDWQDVYVCALTKAILDALKIGDQPAQDISQALDDFKTLVLEKFVTQAVEVGLPQYLTENTYSFSGADYTMQNGSDDDWGWMSRRKPLQGKAGAMFSAANKEAIQNHIDGLHKQAKALHSAANDLATVLQGSEPAYGDGEGEPDEGQQEGKSAASRISARGTQARSSSMKEDTAQEDIERGLAIIKGLRTNR